MLKYIFKDESNDDNTDRQISNSNSHQDQSHLPPRNSSASPAQSYTTGTPTNTSSPHPNNHSGSLLNVKNPSPSDLVSDESQGFDISGSPTPPMSGNSYAMQGSPSRHIQANHEVDSLGTDF